jgi:uncharacterized protein YndB with AHSA1/START domain
MVRIELTTFARVGRDRAWEAWTDPAQLAEWWWPQRPDTEYRLDVRPGGTFRIESPAAGMGVHGTYLEVVPEELLRFDWVWLRDDEDTGGRDVVTVTFAGHAEGTLVTVAHETTDADPAGYERGWRECLARLEALPALPAAVARPVRAPD